MRRSEADVEEQQNEQLLHGNTEILERVQRLEEQILAVEKRIMERLGAPH